MTAPHTVDTAAVPLCFVDTETDGVHHGRKPWEIAVIRREPDGREMTWCQFVEIDLATADPFGLRIGRFYDRHPLGKHLAHGYADDPLVVAEFNLVTRRAAAVRVAQLTHGAHIVGAVPNFDTEVFAGLLRSEGLTPAWHYHLVDVENLAVGYLAGKGQTLAPPWKSDDLLALLGIPQVPDDQKHTALGDAQWVRSIYDAVMRPTEVNS